jgi:hypothetical protein
MHGMSNKIGKLKFNKYCILFLGLPLHMLTVEAETRHPQAGGSSFLLNVGNHLLITCVQPGRAQSTMYTWLSNYRSYTLPQNLKRN